MKKSGFIILVIIGIIALGILLGIMGKPEDYDNNVQNKGIYNSSNKENNKNNNIENTNNTNNNENTQVKENVIENKEDTNTEIITEEPKTESQKAIEIVKLDWGDNLENVNISVDGLNNDGRYIISVRDKNTTQALAFYTVNVNDKTFTKKEMN